MEILEEHSDGILSEEISLGKISICMEDTQPTLKRGPSVCVPTCNCDYALWVADSEGFFVPALVDNLVPTRIKEDQCVYCGYYVCWQRIEYQIFESSLIPPWSSPEWYESIPEKTWFIDYSEAKKRVLANQLIEEL